MSALKTAAVLFVLLTAAPAMADHTTQRPIQECVVIHQEGPIWNATPEEVSRGVSFPCDLNYNDALRYYTREINRREVEECPGCCCAAGWEKR